MSAVGYLGWSAFVGCAAPATDAPTPSAGSVPVDPPGAGCPEPSPVVSAGRPLGTAQYASIVAATPSGWLVLRRPDDGSGVTADQLAPDGEVLRTVDVTEEVALPPQSMALAMRDDDAIVLWSTEFELGWRTLSADGALGERVELRVGAFTTPLTAEWFDGALAVTTNKPGRPDRVYRFALDGTLLAGPVEVPDSNRRSGIALYEPGAGELVHLHTLQVGVREQMWRRDLDLDEGPGPWQVLYEGSTLHTGSSLRWSGVSLVAFDDVDEGALVVSVDDGQVRATVPGTGRGFPALAARPDCGVALAVQASSVGEPEGVALHLYDDDLVSQGAWSALELGPGRLAGSHALASGHDRLALTWVEQLEGSTELWFHTIEL